MLQLKPLNEIARPDAGWLRARHHFAIGPYGNPAHKSAGNLMVLNDDEIAPHTGFELHHHANIEVEVNGVLVQAREGLVIKKETAISIKAVLDSELVLVVTA